MDFKVTNPTWMGKDCEEYVDTYEMVRNIISPPSTNAQDTVRALQNQVDVLSKMVAMLIEHAMTTSRPDEVDDMCSMLLGMGLYCSIERA